MKWWTETESSWTKNHSFLNMVNFEYKSKTGLKDTADSKLMYGDPFL